MDDLTRSRIKAAKELLKATASVAGRASLTERFAAPPFSVFDTRQGYWQSRRRLWLSLGIRSELGRGEGLTWGDSPEITTENLNYYRNRSHALTWGIAPDGTGTGKGGRTVRGDGAGSPLKRGAVPTTGGAAYFGEAFRGANAPHENGQLLIDADRGKRAATFGSGGLGDLSRSFRGASSSPEGDYVVPGAYDFLFTCPPYANLEVYSDHPADISTLAWPDFLKAYHLIINASVSLLRPNRFAAIVVSDIRGPDGFYRHLPAATSVAFRKAGALLYNEAVLVSVAGSLPIRVPKQFTAGRKLGRMHQYVLFYLRGDASTAVEALGEIQTVEANRMGNPNLRRARGRFPLDT